MKYLKTITIIIFFSLNFYNLLIAAENLFEEAKKKFEKKDFDKSKFLFQRNIVFNPKNAESYLYLAKIFNNEENQEEEKKNLDTALLLEPNNEEAIYMLINIQLDRSNFEKAKSLMDKFSNVCKKMCNKKAQINKSLQDFEANNEKTN